MTRKLMRQVVLGSLGLLLVLWPSAAELQTRATVAHRGEWEVASAAPEEECQPYQHRDYQGKCVDNPGTVHHRGHYDPKPDEQCWMECKCTKGQTPEGDDDCSPCALVGMVCCPNQQ